MVTSPKVDAGILQEPTGSGVFRYDFTSSAS